MNTITDTNSGLSTVFVSNADSFIPPLKRPLVIKIPDSPDKEPQLKAIWPVASGIEES